MKSKNVFLVVLVLACLVAVVLCQNKNEAYTNYLVKQKAWKVLESGKLDTYAGINDGVFVPQTISVQMKVEMQNILGSILNMINQQTGESFYLRKIDRVNVKLLKKGEVGFEETEEEVNDFTLGARYTVDFFAHEVRHMHTRRFIVVFVIDNERNIDVEHVNLSNAFKLPENTDDNDVNDKLIITDDSLLNNTYHIKGVEDTNLEMGDYLPNDNKITNKYIKANYQEVGLPFLPVQISSDSVSENNGLPNFPNRKQSKWWDSYGVKYTESEKPGNIGVDHAVDERPQQNYDNPTVNRMVTDVNSDNSWLFNSARGNLGIPKGQVVM